MGYGNKCHACDKKHSDFEIRQCVHHSSFSAHLPQAAKNGDTKHGKF